MSDGFKTATTEPTIDRINPPTVIFERSSSLTEEDLNLLESSSWVNRETANRTHLRRVDTSAAAEMLGRKDEARKNYAGILFPYFLPGLIHPHGYRIRRDQPEYETGKNGHPKEINKYMAPAGTRNRLYFPPGITPEDLIDTQLTVIITEGEKKALSLHRLARHETDSPRFLALGLPGVWNFRGIVGKGTNEKGERVDIRGVIPDLDLLRYSSRKFVTAFDADFRSNDDVRRARTNLEHVLRGRGAKVRHLEIPADSGANGIDALLALWGPGKVLQLIEETVEMDAVRDHCYRRGENDLWRVTSSRDGPLQVQLTNFDARIIAEILQDDGLQQQRLFELEAHDRFGHSHWFTLSPHEFSLMNWPAEKIGWSAVVFPNQRDHARAAIQCLSDTPPKQTIYTHIGWRQVLGDWIYLHAGGAIGPAGNVPDVSVKLEGALRRYELQLPSSSEKIELIRASLGLLDLIPNKMFGLVAAVYRSVLKGSDFVVHLAGPTGTYKTALAALLQQHFGVTMSDRNLPGSWSSTANSLEVLAFEAKDAISVIDDFAPKGSMQEVSNMHASAERLIRAAGNHSGRGRLSAHGILRESKPPRGLLVSTGEDIPSGHSVRARVLTIEISKGDVNLVLLSKLQKMASCGIFCRCLAGFLQWLATDYAVKLAHFEEHVMLHCSELRDGTHPRTPRAVAELQLGFELFLTYALEIRAIEQPGFENLAGECRGALRNLALQQQQHQSVADPTCVFLDLINTAIVSNRAYVASSTGGPPDEAAAWGWHKTECDVAWKPSGICIGWLEGDNLYLDPNAAYLTAQEVGRSTGESLPIGKRTLHKRLGESGRLLGRDAARETYTVRRTIAGTQRNVLHLSALGLHLLTSNLGDL